MANKYSSFYTALKRHPQLTKEQAVLDFTNGQTDSLKALDHWELQELTRNLNNINIKSDKADKMRKAVIAIFRRMGRTVDDAIAWAEKQGVKGQKKPFNDYTTGELYVLIGIAEKVLKDWEKGVRQRVANTGNRKFY